MQADGQIGFYWVGSDGTPTELPMAVLADAEPRRLVATHLEAFDDALISAAERFGQILGGGRGPAPRECEDLRELHSTVDRLCLEYAAALTSTGMTADVRAGKIIGTAALFSILARQALGLLGPAPLDGELDVPGLGVVSGFGEMHQVDPVRPWLGGRWIVRTEHGQRYPLTLAMLLFDSSGTNRDAARAEHLQALRTVVDAAELPGADRVAAACAVDWLLYDWLTAHRDGPDSAEITFPKGHESDAEVVVAAAAASAASRAGQSVDSA